MSRRARAAGFALCSVACAGVAAAAAHSYGSGVTRQLGDLVPVVVTSRSLAAGREISERTAHRLLRVRRIPARFAPRGALTRPEEAIGRVPVASLPAGAYLPDSQLRWPRAKRDTAADLPPGRSAVEIAVSGGQRLPDTLERGRVDVVVTAEARGSGPGRSAIAAGSVRLLNLEPLREGEVDSSRGGAGVAETLPMAWIATLALTRGQAIRLIQAENFARQIRLLPSLGPARR